MRVLFTPSAATSHINTQVPLAWALRSAGHQVYVASQPNATSTITHTGLTAIPIGPPLDLADKRAQEPGRPAEETRGDSWLDILDIGDVRPEKSTYAYAHAVLTVWTSVIYQNMQPEQVVDDLVDFAKWWRPDLVVWDTMTFAGPVAAIASGAAHARLLFGLDLIGWIRRHYLNTLHHRPAPLHDDPLEEWLGWTLQRHGCHFTEQAVTGQWTIDPVPTSLRLPVDHHYLPVRYIPYNGPATLPHWLRTPPPRPRVCLTLGVSHREVLGGDRANLTDLINAVADLDIDVIATLNHTQKKGLGTLPDNVHTTDFVPLDALLPTCAAIIHHGGSGTFQTALTHGIPQIIVPDMRWDTRAKAERLHHTGAGIHLTDPDHLTPQDIRTALTDVLHNPAYTHHATRLQTELHTTPTPADLIPTLEKLTHQHRTTG
ncbi:activator-dependent family glycosyltransferase [Streptomyces sp. MMS24-I31]|uniref:activator-dependent family glycosyltransferase n=1 Tax=Streptomyces sp. MMS24-I31 TaxID=3351563 RepID=UPI003896A706